MDRIYDGNAHELRLTDVVSGSLVWYLAFIFPAVISRQLYFPVL